MTVLIPLAQVTQDHHRIVANIGVLARFQLTCKHRDMVLRNILVLETDFPYDMRRNAAPRYIPNVTKANARIRLVKLLSSALATSICTMVTNLGETAFGAN